MTRDYAADRLTFDEEPQTKDLGALLLPQMSVSSANIEEKGAQLIVRPQLIPIRPAVIFLIFFGAFITALPFLAPKLGLRFEGPVAWLMIIGMWVLIMPSFVTILWLVNGRLRKHGIGAIAHSDAQTLELPRVGRTVAAEDVLYFTDLRRWDSQNGSSRKILQTGVLVREPEGGFTHFMIERQLELPVLAKAAGAQLAAHLDRPLRRVSLSSAESKNQNRG